LVCHDTITALAWRPGPHGHLASGDDDGTIALWQATTGRPAAQLRPVRTLTSDSPVTALVWAGPGLLIAAHHNGQIEAHQLPDRTSL
jgi:WD40 repeat protein